MKVLLSDGSLVGNQRTVGDFEVDFERVRDVSLADWFGIIDAASAYMEYTVEVWRDRKFILLDIVGDGIMQFTVDVKGPEWEEQDVVRAMATVCAASGDTLAEVIYEDGYWIIHVHCQPDDRSTADIFAMQDVCQGMLGPERLRTDQVIDAETARRLLLQGAAGLLIGLVESDWLEVKSRGYDLDSFAGQIELAQDVARFANGHQSALLVLGLRTERMNGVDRIVKFALLDLPAKSPTTYRDVIDRRVYPPIEGLSVDLVQMSGRSILVIWIPGQPEAVKPFIVHGAVVDGRNEGAFISIVRRRGEGSIPASPQEIHALLSAGRSALRTTPLGDRILEQDEA